MDRKSELEKKKAQLEELKKKRLIRETQTVISTQTPVLSVTSKHLIEEILTDIESIKISPSSSAHTLNESLVKLKNGIRKRPVEKPTAETLQKMKSFTLNCTKPIEIPAREPIFYSKETQTAPDTETDPSMLSLNRLPLEAFDGPFIYDTLQWEDEFHMSPNGTSQDMVFDEQTLNDYLEKAVSSKFKLFSPQNTQSTDINEDQVIDIKFGNERQLKDIVSCDDFWDALKRQSEIIEKALTEEDIFFDYGQVDTKDLIKEHTDPIKVSMELFDERWKNRVVTSIDWSAYQPELILNAFDSLDYETTDGVVLVWNLKYGKNTPQYVFKSSSWVTSCCFYDYNPNLIIGGTYSGQIVMWDIRSNKQTPIQRSTLSLNSHTNPVFCLKVVGSEHSNNLMSISNDGRVCSWSLDNMNLPFETSDLQMKQLIYIPVTCMDFKADAEHNKFIVGTEDSFCYSVSRYGSKMNINDMYEGHYGPVTGISCNQSTQNKSDYDFSNLFLSSSFDSSIKLWDAKEPALPIHSFEENSNEYICDVQWSPVNPAMFASADESGRVRLWNMLHSTELPMSTIRTSNTHNNSLNKIKWSHSGCELVAGDDQGKLYVCNINEGLSRMKNDESKNLVRIVKELKYNSSELHELSGLHKGSSQPVFSLN